MIAIYTVDGTELQLKSGSVITISWISTAFNDGDQFLGSFSYPVALAYSPQNNKALGMANRLENRSSRQDIPVMVRIFGIHWKRCTLSFTIDTDSYSAFLKIDNGVFGNLIKNTLLTDLFVTKDANGTFTGFKWLQLTNTYNGTMDYLNNSGPDTTGKYPAYFFPVYNENLFGSFGGGDSVDPGYDDQFHTVNAWSSGIGWISDPIAPLTSQLFFTPFFSLHYVVKQVLSFLGYTGAGDFFTDPLLMDKVIYNTGFFDMARMYAATGLKVSLAQHLPGISLSDFFKKLRTEFKLAIYFDADTVTCTINIVRNTLKSRARVDISGHVSPKYSVKSSLPLGYELVQPTEDGDNMFKNSTYDKSFLIGNQEAPTSVDGFIATLFMQHVTNPLTSPFNYQYRVPHAQQTGNAYTTLANGSDAYNDPLKNPPYNKNTFGLRLLTYRGMHNDSDGHPYPYASGDDQASNSTDDNPISDYGLSLWLNGEKGILQVYNFDWYNFFLRTELVELDAYLPMRLMSRITPLGLLEFRTPSQSIIPAMLNDMTFEASQNERLLESKMRVYPIYSQKDVDQPAISTFTPSQVINPGGIYVKFVLTIDTGRSTTITLKGTKQWLDLYTIGTLYFYSDEAGTIPKDVTELGIFIHYTQYLIKNGTPGTTGQYDLLPFPQNVTSSDGVFTLPNTDRKVEHKAFDPFSDSFSKVITTYNLVVDPKVLAAHNVTYKVIGDIYGGMQNVPPVP